MQSDLSVLTTLKALQGVHHKILEDKDTIGSFSITTGGFDKTKLFYTNRISNGIDTTSITQINETTAPISVIYDYRVNGIMREHRFNILIYANHYIREIWIDGILVATVFGDSFPEKFVLSSTINNLPLLNFMILFSYQSFFSTKSLTEFLQ